MTDADLHTYPPPSSPENSIVSVRTTPISVGESFFGMHVQLTSNIPAAFRDLPIRTVRVHDSAGGTRWHNINPANGTFVWTNTDEWVNAMLSRGVELMFLLGFTPDWAAASTPNTGKYDNGTTVRASNQPPSNMAFWDTFVTAVATRYAGRIRLYEIWNEPNYTNYWAGTQAQLAEMHRRAYQIIKGIDSGARIVGPVVQEPETGGTGNAYLDGFLKASDGATGTGKDWIDICGIHMYPPRYNFEIHKNQIDNVRATLTANGVGSLPIWNTETGALQGDTYDDTVQAKWLARSFVLAAACGVERYYWYTYDNPQMFMTNLDKEAFLRVRQILLSGSMTGCNICSDGRVACTVAGRNYIF